MLASSFCDTHRHRKQGGPYHDGLAPCQGNQHKTLDLSPATMPIHYLNAHDLIKAQQGADGTTTT